MEEYNLNQRSLFGCKELNVDIQAEKTGWKHSIDIREVEEERDDPYHSSHIDYETYPNHSVIKYFL